VRYFISIIGLAVVLSACGASSDASPVPAANKTYKDKTYPMSFRYPATWKAPAKGKSELLSSGPAYVIRLTIPTGVANAEIQITENPPALPVIKNGLVRPDPAGGTDTFHYFNTRVGGHPAIRVERFAGAQEDQIDTFVNAAKVQYVVRVITAQPPFTRRVKSGYALILRSMRLPFA
jgi:hypothetical protein